MSMHNLLIKFKCIKSSKSFLKDNTCSITCSAVLVFVFVKKPFEYH